MSSTPANALAPLGQPNVPELLAAFQRDGYARAGKLLSDEGALALADRIDDLMQGRITYEGLFFQKDTESGNYNDLSYGKGYEGPSDNYRKIEKLERDPLFLAWINNPAFEAIARALIPGDIVLYRALIFAKKAHGGSNLPWHQDGGRFWGLDRDPILQIWTALDDAEEEAGCVEVVPGTHADGLSSPLGGVVQAPQVLAANAEARAVPVPAKRGEVLLIHNHLWHRSGVNRTDHPRRAFTVCYMTAETKCLRTKKAPRVFFPVFRKEEAV